MSEDAVLVRCARVEILRFAHGGIACVLVFSAVAAPFAVIVGIVLPARSSLPARSDPAAGTPAPARLEPFLVVVVVASCTSKRCLCSPPGVLLQRCKVSFAFCVSFCGLGFRRTAVQRSWARDHASGPVNWPAAGPVTVLNWLLFSTAHPQLRIFLLVVQR